jgi:hypothetical protein
MNTQARVPTSQTGDSQSDGGTQGIKLPSGPARQPNLGRHFQNSRTANVGTLRGSGSEPDGNHPITGVSPSSPIHSMVPRPSIPADQAETSKDLERRLVANPQPFTYEGGAATLTTDRLDMSQLGEPYNVMSPVDAKTRSMGTHVGCANTGETNWAATGDSKPGGYNSINSGYPTRGNQRQAGQPGTRSNKSASGREIARTRQTGY